MNDALVVQRPESKQAQWSPDSPNGEGLAGNPVDRDGTLAQLTEWVHYLSDQLMQKEGQIQQLQRELERSWSHRWQRWWQGQRK